MSSDSREKAMAAVQGIFDKYNHLLKTHSYTGYDTHVMATATLLDAYTNTSSSSSSSTSPSPTTTNPTTTKATSNTTTTTTSPTTPAISTAISTTIFSLPIDASYSNMNGVMHGGAAGVIFDMMTTVTLGPVAREGFWDFLGGVTRTLNISYLKAVPIGTTVKIKSEVLQVGKTMALIRGTMMSLDESTAYCTCEHHKVGVPTRREHLMGGEGKAKL